MRQPKDCELFQEFIKSSTQSNIKAAKNKIFANVGVVSTREHLEEQMVSLKNIRKTSYYPLMAQVFQLSSTMDYVVPICFEHNLVPANIPFISFKSNGHFNAVRPGLRIYPNLYSIGSWNVDSTKFNISSLDLYCALETGVIMYNIQKKGEQILLNDNNILETSSRIYARLFLKSLERTKRSLTGVDQDLALFILAKFFMIYLLGKDDTEYTNDIANKATVLGTSKTILSQMEEASTMKNYSSLSGFLKFFEDILGTGEITLRELAANWIKLYGSKTIFMIEYFPYFLHFVFAGIKGSQTTSFLYNRRKEIEKDGFKLYQSVISHM